MYYKKIIGDRIYLSPMSAEDYETYARWINDESLSSGLGNYKMYISTENEKAWLESVCKGNDHHYAVVRLEDDVLLGTYGLEVKDLVSRRFHVGGYIGEQSERGKGYGTEALRLLSAYAFDVLNVNTLFSGVFAFNDASVKSAQKAGYSIAGTFHDAYYYKGKYWDEYCIEYTRNAYYEQKDKQAG